MAATVVAIAVVAASVTAEIVVGGESGPDLAKVGGGVTDSAKTQSEGAKRRAF